MLFLVNLLDYTKKSLRILEIDNGTLHLRYYIHFNKRLLLMLDLKFWKFQLKPKKIVWQE